MTDASAVDRAELVLDPRRVFPVLWGLAGVLLVLGLVAGLALRNDVPFVVDTLGRLLLLDAEAAVPAWYATVLLLACGGGFLPAAAARPALRWRLRVLAGLLVVLSLDEGVELHNRAGGALLLLTTGDPDGGPYSTWVLAVLPLVLLVGWFVLPVLRALPRDVHRRWWLAALLYVGGAAGMELVGSAFALDSVAFVFCVVVEEGLELAGALVLLRSLLVLATGGNGPLRLSWACDDAAEPATSESSTRLAGPSRY